MQLNETDYTLLSYLYHSYNEPISKISKETGLTRDQVRYKMEKYSSEGLILKYYPVFDYSKLGYKTLVSFFLKFETNSMSEKFMKKIRKNKNCISFVEIYSKYDLGIDCIFKDEEELNKFIEELFEDKECILREYVLIKSQFTEVYPLKIIEQKKKESYQISGFEDKEIKLDKLDLKILKILSDNGRERLIDIATKCGISSEAALYRVRRLKKEKVILGNRILFNKTLLGYHSSLILINFNRFSKENKEKVLRIARNSKYTSTLSFNLNKPHCLIQILHKDEEELRQTTEGIRKTFEDEPIDLEILPTGEERNELNTLPFL